MRESDVLVGIQDTLYDAPATLPVARGLSHFGEHALGWMALGVAGAAVDDRRRSRWLAVSGSAFLSHAASVVIKRIVRRKRPHDPRIRIGVATPSKLSFPSSHATSTTAALVAVSRITRSPWPLLGVPVMMLSRMVLGVHYPTDVAAGATLGAATADVVCRAVEKRERNNS
ncbi:phosphatase PAP2 family protein [Corynebacterium sp. CCM 8835]|uniref:Phosphatase PAP2 family protein n=1 Tax=Corynebacterium antarcticum TaxID=2800405 RepID=A0A9Q4CFK3_9CORY|nr:phosphatase PAP2 family protein [Corynebacterium antarcticum]MCK7643195.1 phosphatase PAP2 family protein [Corynebacterium antarcticum]MCK7661698.1 phosphatase PAP2 family protein [Corynebacterium antarcticum]MCL0246643.1 phosphatase PAP2 family protein [Corynebacterium antarcticum]MCX7492784.1 phosphatase PAP2 family protein [Corynebacterium antarcticum]MCX7538722.1 phosphatase PAP2 family protein [Corynebacterium antarcticum]